MPSPHDPDHSPARRHRRGALALALGALLGAVGASGPADALLRPADTDAGLIDRLADPPSDRASDLRPDRPADLAPSDVRPVDRLPEYLRLDCALRQTDERSAVACRWSVPSSDGAVAVRLLRATAGSGEPRSVIHRTTELEENEFIDAQVRPGHRYHYAVQALDVNHRVVGTSRTVTVGVPPVDTPPDVEVLKIHCRAGAADSPSDRIHVGCEWSVPQRPGARLLTLWRSVDGGAREQVASSPPPFRSSYRDVVPAGTRSVVYAVIATDGDGEIVARSRAARVTIPRTRPDVAPDAPVIDRPQPPVVPADPARPVDPVPPVTAPPVDLAPPGSA
ncbi:MAG: hypothetical protein HKN44_10580, partial [Ilumatobacter sp.]|nr:hypothetical protein [Ilumatobacter sp.]